GRAGGEQHAGGVGQGADAVGLEADVVTGDHVAVAARAGDADAGAGVPADDVTGRGRRAADGVVERVADGDAADVREGGGAGRVRADEVAGDHVVVRQPGVDRVVQVDTGPEVAGDDVGLQRVAGAVGVGAEAVAGDGQQGDAGGRVGQRRRAGRV